MRFLALGDSYTIGESVGADGRWPNQLAARLRAQGIDLNDPEIIAKTGWTTDELAAGIEAADPQGPYDLVTLLIGVNNQYRGRPLAEYRFQFAALLRQAIAFASNDSRRVIVLSIPDWSVVPFAAQDARSRDQIRQEVDDFNAVNRDEAARAGVHYADVTPMSRRALVDESLTAVDGLHPSAAMYSLWVDLVAPVAGKIAKDD